MGAADICVAAAGGEGGVVDRLVNSGSSSDHPLFEPVAMTKGTAGASELFYARSANYDAEDEYTEEGFVVLKGSKARKEITPSSVGASFVKRREALIAEGILKEDERFYIFQKDVLFKTPSGASDLVAGTSTNGWMVWKAKSGKTLDALKRLPLVD